VKTIYEGERALKTENEWKAKSPSTNDNINNLTLLYGGETQGGEIAVKGDGKLGDFRGRDS
jgi:hypothetical protein